MIRCGRRSRCVALTATAGYLVYSLIIILTFSFVPADPSLEVRIDHLMPPQEKASPESHDTKDIKEILLETSKEYSWTIPRVVHQTWDDKEVPGQVAKWLPSWKRLNPHFEHWFWTDNGTRDLIDKEFHSEFVELYDAYPHKINKADVRRLFILYQHGGIFADLDVECLRPLSELLSQYTCVLSQEPVEHQTLFYDDEHKNYALTGFMACRPGHPFFRFVIRQLAVYARNARSSDWNMNILNSTGPVFVAEAVDKYVRLYNHTEEGRLHIAPSSWFMPSFDPIHEDQFYMKCTRPETPLTVRQRTVCDQLKMNNFKNAEIKDAYTDHHWLHTWGFLFIPLGSIDVTEVVNDVKVIDRKSG